MKLEAKIIKHKDFKDVALYVFREDWWSESVVLHGIWCNQGFTKSWQVMEEKNVQIFFKDIGNWLVLDEDALPYMNSKKCLRNTTNWVTISI